MPLRRALLFLARQPGVRHWVETSAVTQKLAHRFVAGSTLEQALAVCRQAHSEGIATTLDYLGENVTSLEDAAACRDTYLRMLNALHAAGLESNVSLKLTQFGLDLSAEACEANVGALVEKAAQLGGFVRLDMEASPYTERTLAIAGHLYARYGACGTVIQAYLRRSAADIAALIPAGIRIRLCKGAYLEPPEVAFEDKAEVDSAYATLAETLLGQATYPAIATHDENLIRHVRTYASVNSVVPARFEFQMLYGIRRDLQKQLIAAGFRLRLYVPFGEAWYPYFMRRLAERPANLLFLLRNIFRA